MKLLRARFENFRLLRDLELDFSTDPLKKLTVIRAANESGKTTILHALQWALYGDSALPNSGKEFRLHPIDWTAAEGARVPINGTIEFEITRYNKMGGVLKETTKRYRIVRSTFEEIQGAAWNRPTSTVRLFALTDLGADPIDAPEALINDELPPELREVFFTDGDRALSFIESDVAVSTKRERVQRAIRSLLGLGVVEAAKRHIERAAAEINRQARNLGGNTDLTRAASRLDEFNNDIARQETAHKDAHSQFVAFDEKLSEVEKKIDETLRKGDREKLRRDLEAAKRALERLDDRIAAANKEHAQLFRSEALARDMLAPVLKNAFDKLKDLHDKGKIPNTTIPVLEERLNSELCICGESLRDDGSDGTRRREHICKLVENSRKADQVQELVTDLYYGSKSLEQRDGDVEQQWMTLYTKVAAQRLTLQNLREEEGRKYKTLELQLDALPDTDIQALREVHRQYRDQRDRFNAEKAKIETQLENLRKERQKLEQDRDRLLRAQKRGARILSELEVTNDIFSVLENAYQRITNEELAKVSELMNKTFLEMIGADPEQGAIIKKAAISRDFDIIVYGPNDRTLNPDRDLNGASRRALTLAFILALTKVSEVQAPNVIDTPLGMMSGYVKRSVLRTAIRESSQLILLLTHSEIAGCEELLDDAAGLICTLTNPAHYPKMLANNPNTRERKVLKCRCNHRRHCELCERRTDAELVLESVT
jgi:DNA sulfur modification protein DndD